jgi:phosphoribosylformimino-5-aminoimidazole carboxamide ribotide isomerase
MIAIPAVDLRDGACVQLVGGSYASERVREPDPVGVARRWAEMGFARVHVVDLDAATSRGDNSDVVHGILRECSASVQVGGGVRTTERATELLEAGAQYVVVGTRAIDDAAWLADLAVAYPDRVIVATDARGRDVVTHGWTTGRSRDVVSFTADLADLPLAGVLVTAVHREGLMQGPDLPLMRDVVRAARMPVLASGGIASRRDLDNLADHGVAGAIIGMALYTGALEPRIIAEEYGT